MAAGYVIALCLEAAGLVGLVIAACAMRAEGRARSAELRDFLRSGQTGGAAAPARRGTPARDRARSADVPVVLTGTGPAGHSAARAALRRALVREGTDLVGPLSAG